jgi:hypothetical protein
VERSTVLEERRFARRFRSFQSPRSKLDLPGLPLFRAQPARAGPPSFKIRCHRPAYNVELARTQNPLPKPYHRLTNRPSELIYLRYDVIISDVKGVNYQNMNID